MHKIMHMNNKAPIFDEKYGKAGPIKGLDQHCGRYVGG